VGETLEGDIFGGWSESGHSFLLCFAVLMSRTLCNFFSVLCLYLLRLA